MNTLRSRRPTTRSHVAPEDIQRLLRRLRLLVCRSWATRRRRCPRSSSSSTARECRALSRRGSRCRPASRDGPRRSPDALELARPGIFTRNRSPLECSSIFSFSSAVRLPFTMDRLDFGRAEEGRLGQSHGSPPHLLAQSRVGDPRRRRSSLRGYRRLVRVATASASARRRRACLVSASRGRERRAVARPSPERELLPEVVDSMTSDVAKR